MPVSPPPSPWFAPAETAHSSKIRLICFPYAGGGSATYHRWARQLPDWITVVPVRLPGREMRLREPPVRNMADVVTRVTDDLGPCWQDLPFALFGHSMGAAIAFEVTRRLRQQGRPLPIQLFVSSCRAPHIENNDPLLHPLPDDAMINGLLERYGTAPSTTDDERALMGLLANTLRADLELMETYAVSEQPPLPCDILALGGAADPGVPRHTLEAWSQHTQANFACRVLPGDHFYLRPQENRLLDLIVRQLAARLDS